jgi:hypothetical protein
VNIRYAAHAICLDAGSVLLTQFGDGDVNPGSWTLPGGGLDWREPPDQGVLRKLYEETGLHGRVRSCSGSTPRSIPPTAAPPSTRSGSSSGSMPMGAPHVVDRDGSPSTAAGSPTNNSSTCRSFRWCRERWGWCRCDATSNTPEAGDRQPAATSFSPSLNGVMRANPERIVEDLSELVAIPSITGASGVSRR